MRIAGTIGIIFLTGLPAFLSAQPDFSRYTDLEGVRCYKDAHNAGIAYYSPGKLGIAADPDGKPDFNLLQTRYTGSYLYGDQGTLRFSGMVRFRIVMNRLSQEKFDKIRLKMWPAPQKGDLRPLPLYDIQTVLGFTSLAATEGRKDTLNLGGGNLTMENADGETKKGLFWKEREFSLRLDNFSSQALWEGLTQGQTIMSFSYAFFSRGVNPSSAEVISDGSALSRELVKKLKAMKDSAKTNLFCVAADAFSVTIDPVKWPDLLKKIDINEDIPPGYPALEVRCYDFSGNLRPDLYAKNVEFRAQATGRGDVITTIRFDRKNPDLSVYHIRFPFAVRVDKPLFYRVTEISDAEMPVKTDWKQLESWNAMIDVTSSQDKIKTTQPVEQ